MIEHPFPPLFNEQSEILILGSFPSVKSREQLFFYGHPQNRFWKVLAAVFHQQTPESIDQKREFLLKNKVALWDVIARCEIVGSSDASIKDAVANDIRPILAGSKIRKIYVNGATAKKLYDRYIYKMTEIEAVALPSTSPANAAWSVERLVEVWRMIVND
jgi:hypoxanthine-DNA glycosylase